MPLRSHASPYSQPLATLMSITIVAKKIGYNDWLGVEGEAVL